MSGFNSIAIQVVLIAMAIFSSVFIVGNYPVPRPPDPELLPMHTIVIQTWDVKKNLDEPRVITPATGIDVQFFFWGDVGPTDELATTSASNASGLIEVIVSFLESKDSIGPLAERLYAVLPAGVETRTPSQSKFFIKTFLSIEICNDAVCLLCLNNDTSLIATAEKVLFALVKTFISKGEINTDVALEIFL